MLDEPATSPRRGRDEPATSPRRARDEPPTSPRRARTWTDELCVPAALVIEIVVHEQKTRTHIGLWGGREGLKLV